MEYCSNIVSTALKDPFMVIHESNGNIDELCQRADIPLNGFPESISLRKFVKFTQNASEDLNIPDFGWQVGSIFNVANLGEVGVAVLEAPSLGAALTLMKNAFEMVQSDSEVKLDIEGDEAVLTYRILDLDIWPRHQDAELSMSVFEKIARQAAGERWRPNAITLEHSTSAIWKNAFAGPKCQIKYDAPSNTIRFPVQLLDLPLQNDPEDTFQVSSQSLLLEAMKRGRKAPVAVRVQREILRRLGECPSDQTEIAKVLGMSRRTLRRRLEVEGTYFSNILSNCRIKVAKRMLENSPLPLSSVAVHLGYSDTTAFERAFKQKQNQTPAQYREKQVHLLGGLT